ncbi:MAG: thiamine-phosphate kinase [Rickettsiales bacterium]|nr:thiamine-phosphate kinase [Rickettsiales bacterium]
MPSETSLLRIIENQIGDKYIGDDCAYLEDLGIVMTQDSLVEDVHFCIDWITPQELGYKSIMVNVSDVCASGCMPKYITVALSLPKNVSAEWVEGFYEGAKKACAESGVEIVGGDLTGSDKVMISCCAIGEKVDGCSVATRSGARAGYKVVVSGECGNSAVGLGLLIGQIDKNIFTAEEIQRFIISHLTPRAEIEFSRKVALQMPNGALYAMMDTSDGLIDALAKIADRSGIGIVIDFEKIPVCSAMKKLQNWQDFVLFGGEDYKLVACVPQEVQCTFGTVIGGVIVGRGVDVKIGDKVQHFDLHDVQERTYQHFE